MAAKAKRVDKEEMPEMPGQEDPASKATPAQRIRVALMMATLIHGTSAPMADRAAGADPADLLMLERPAALEVKEDPEQIAPAIKAARE